MAVGPGFSLEQSIDKNGVADHDRHADERDGGHDLKRVKPSGTVVNGQAVVRIVGSGDQVGKLRRSRRQKQADQRNR